MSNLSGMSQVLSLWRRCIAVPVVGARVFSFAFAQKAPYFSSIRPRFTMIEPNHAELVIRDRRGVHNHLGTVHAIALCNGLEAAMGALAEATIPSTRRWIPKGMTVSYTREGGRRHHLHRRDRPGPVELVRARPAGARTRRRPGRRPGDRGRDQPLGDGEEGPADDGRCDLR